MGGRSARSSNTGRTHTHAHTDRYTHKRTHTHIACLKAAATLQWWNYLESQVPTGKTPLRINFDETSICLFQGGGKGTVFMSRKKRRPTQSVPRGRTRQYMSLVAFVCDQTMIQPVLPQHLIGNEKTLPAKQLGMLRARCPANIKLTRQKSAWNNDKLCRELLRQLAEALLPYLDKYQPILIFDACKVHLVPSVLSYCHALGIWPLVVSARLTWLLQPLDVNGFWRLKCLVRRSYQHMRIQLRKSDLNIQEFLDCMYTALKPALQGIRWAPVFDRCGYGGAQQLVGQRVKTAVPAITQQRIAADRPTLELLRLCWPRKLKVPIRAVLGPFHSDTAHEHVSSPQAISVDEIASTISRPRRSLPTSFTECAARHRRRVQVTLCAIMEASAWDFCG